MAKVYLVQHTNVGPFEKGSEYKHAPVDGETDAQTSARLDRLLRLGAIAPKVVTTEVEADDEDEEVTGPSAQDLAMVGVIPTAGTAHEHAAVRQILTDQVGGGDTDGDGSVDDFEEMPFAALKARGKAAGISGAAGMPRADLIAALKEKQAPLTPVDETSESSVTGGEASGATQQVAV